MIAVAEGHASSEDAVVNGMKPLAHAPATVIKAHGNYLDLIEGR